MACRSCLPRTSSEDLREGWLDPLEEDRGQEKQAEGSEEQDGQAGPVRWLAVIDHGPVGIEQREERVERHELDEELVVDGERREGRGPVQAGREVEPQPQRVPADIADVAVEH